jgi:hypothetical protein
MSARSHPELLVLLRAQYGSLVELGGAFDAGSQGLALQLSVVVRVLVYETLVSHALLNQMRELDRMRFYDSSVPLNPANLVLTHAGLALMQMVAGRGSVWVPNLDAPVPRLGARGAFVSFAKWWTGSVVVRDAQGATWTRSKVVLDLANKEGGAHVDPDRPEELKAVQDGNSMGWTYSDATAGSGQPMLNGPLFPSVRQIAYELQKSLEAHFRDRLAAPQEILST